MIGANGEPVSWEVETPAPACLVVDELTDAVKLVEGDALGDSIDRDELWAVRGFALSREVVASLTPGTYSAGELIVAVRASGYAWSVLTIASS